MAALRKTALFYTYKLKILLSFLFKKEKHVVLQCTPDHCRLKGNEQAVEITKQTVNFRPVLLSQHSNSKIAATINLQAEWILKNCKDGQIVV